MKKKKLTKTAQSYLFESSRKQYLYELQQIGKNVGGHSEEGIKCRNILKTIYNELGANSTGVVFNQRYEEELMNI